MAENTSIEWADHTFNTHIGCTRVSDGCAGCYAAVSTPARVMGIKWGAGEARKRTSPSTWAQPRRWNARHAEFFALHGRRQRVFCASLSDVFDNEIPSEWRADLFQLIISTPNLDWLLLTKRIGNAKAMIAEAVECPMDMMDVLRPLPNVWIGATVVNQEEADRDIPKLLAAPAVKRFLSMEPLLGPVELGHWIGTTKAIGATTFRDENNIYRCDLTGTPVDGIDWVIVGGESGPSARPMHPDWARSLRDQCTAAGVPYLFKQWGEWREPEHGENFDTSMGRAAKPPAFILSETGTVHCFESEHIVNGKPVIKVGKKEAGRLLDGRTWDEVPE